MKKKRAIFLGCILFALFTSAQTQKGEIDITKVPAAKEHFQDEYTFDSPTEPARWLNQKPGLQVSFASTDQIYFRTEVPDLKKTSEWQIGGWKGERVNTMILVWSPDTLNQVRFVLKDLANE